VLIQPAYLWESSNFLVSVATEILLCVVDSHSTVNAVRKSGILHDRNTLVGAVVVLEEHGCSPIIAVECQMNANVRLARRIT
jgi:hypothetical protein